MFFAGCFFWVFEHSGVLLGWFYVAETSKSHEELGSGATQQPDFLR